MKKNHWLVKQEPKAYPWRQLVEDKTTNWDGVRNYQARNNLRSMKKGDLVLFYHSVVGKEVVGIAEVAKEHFPDLTAEKGDWSAVEIKALQTLNEPVSLETIKGEESLQNMLLVRNSRISVMPVTAKEFNRILKLGKTKLSH